MLAALTGAGLSAAAGLNAFIPLVMVGLLARFTSVIELPTSLTWISSGWAIGIGIVLLLADVVLDKVAGADHVNDIVQSAVRPVMGSVIFTATAGAQQLENSDWWRDHPWVSLIAGAVLAGTVHTGKAASRPIVNAGTFGVATPFVSAAEDVTSVGVSAIAIFVPILIIAVLVLLAWGLFHLFRIRRRWQDRRYPVAEIGAAPG